MKHNSKKPPAVLPSLKPPSSATNVMRSTSASRSRNFESGNGGSNGSIGGAPITSVVVKNSQRRSSSSSSSSGHRQCQQGNNPTMANNSTASPSESFNAAHTTIDTPNTTNTTNNNSTDVRARIYKAQAYEAKIRMASQEQRIEALKAELEEVKFFQDVECEQQHSHYQQQQQQQQQQYGNINTKDNGNGKDAELIEALASELETLERDLKIAQDRNVQLELNLDNTHSNSNSNSNRPDESMELRRIIEQQRKEIEQSKQDAAEGVSIMRDLDKALRSARHERDESRSERDEVLGEMAKMRAEMEKLKKQQLQSDHQQQEQQQQHQSTNNDISKYQALEQSHAELQNVLALVQAQSEKNSDKMKQTLKEAHAREESLEAELQTLVNRYEERRKESKELEETLMELSDKFEEQTKELEGSCAAMEELEGLHAMEMDTLRKEHEMEMEKKISLLMEQSTSKFDIAQQAHKMILADKKKEYEVEVSNLKEELAVEIAKKDNYLTSREGEWKAKATELQTAHDNLTSEMNDAQEELARSQSKNKAFAALESNYLSEIKTLKLSIEELEKSSNHEKSSRGELDNTISNLRLENSRLKIENARLLRQIDSEDRIEFESKLLQKEKEVKNLQLQLDAAVKEKNTTPVKGGQADADLLANNKKLKHDLLSAVECSISRAKEIQSLEKELETCNSKFAKATQKIRKLEKAVAAVSAPPPPKINDGVSEEEKKRLVTEISSLRSKAWQADDTISGLKQEINLLSSKLSRTERLERELTESRTKIVDLKEALTEMEFALQALSKQRFSTSSTKRASASASSEVARDEGSMEGRESLGGERGNEEKKRQIEDDALNEYFTQRMNVGK